jgi:hypothetical protein
LAKTGQPRLIREKIAVMEEYVDRHRGVVEGGGISGWLGTRLSGRLTEDIVKETWFNIGYYYQQFDDYENARHWFETLCEALPGERDTRWAHYNMACIAALTGQPEESVRQLTKSFEAGFLDISWMDEDGDLRSIRGREDYRALRNRMAGTDRDGPVPMEADDRRRDG